MRGPQTLTSPPRAARILHHARELEPKTRETADHSLACITARAMFDGDINNESFSEQKFRDPTVLTFMQKISRWPKTPRRQRAQAEQSQRV